MWRVIRRSFSFDKPSKELLESLTYYELLEVKPNSPKAEIRKAYLALARKHHPDLQTEPSVKFK
jgi:curved DNA-binding protein CbpA